MKYRCMLCGKEFVPNPDLRILYGRGDGKTILSFVKTIELRTCSQNCALRLTKLAYEYFWADSSADEKSEF